MMEPRSGGNGGVWREAMGLQSVVFSRLSRSFGFTHAYVKPATLIMLRNISKDAGDMSDFDDDEEIIGQDGVDKNALYTQRLRLNKFVAERGICSRRDADLWIESGRVTVNDEIVDVGAYVDDKDEVRVDGELIAAFKIPKRVYIALNKPIDVECTTDTRVDGNIIDFVGHHERIFPIGRLDKDSDGLILLTNDGDIVNKILRAEHNHEKEYLVTVDHKISAAFLSGMATGVRILRRTTKPCRTYKVSAMTFGIVLTEGMNRQIRKMAEAFNYQVLKLTRVRIMNVELGHIKLGRWRNLTDAELVQLRAGAAAPKSVEPKQVFTRGPRPGAASAPRKARGEGPVKSTARTTVRGNAPSGRPIRDASKTRAPRTGEARGASSRVWESKRPPSEGAAKSRSDASIPRVRNAWGEAKLSKPASTWTDARPARSKDRAPVTQSDAKPVREKRVWTDAPPARTFAKPASTRPTSARPGPVRDGAKRPGTKSGARTSTSARPATRAGARPEAARVERGTRTEVSRGPRGGIQRSAKPAGKSAPQKRR